MGPGYQVWTQHEQVKSEPAIKDWYTVEPNRKKPIHLVNKACKQGLV